MKAGLFANTEWVGKYIEEYAQKIYGNQITEPWEWNPEAHLWISADGLCKIQK